MKTSTPTKIARFVLWFVSVTVWVLAQPPTARASMTLTDWSPLFKGVDYATGTNTPSADLPNLNIAHAIRVDLKDPDIELFSSPPFPDYQVDVQEAAGYTVSDFLQINHLQIAINANGFYPDDYVLPPGTPMDIIGLAVSRGFVVSPQEEARYSETIAFDQQNVGVIRTNWPPQSTDGIYTAVSGMYAVLLNGQNLGGQYATDPDFVHHRNPRTAMGLSQDKQYLYLLVIDGRQPDYSEGALDSETGAWLQRIGAWDGINLDGGGSTTMVMEDTTGMPLTLNSSSAVLDTGKPRTVGSHFGVFAKTLPGFINDVTVSAEDRSATIQWSTVSPATTQVEYGVSTNLGTLTAEQTELVTAHSANITGLEPDTGYYLRLHSKASGTEHVSPLHYFTTTNYLTTNTVFEITNSWTYTTQNLDGVNWTTKGYDDSGWNGPGQGLFWIDTRSGVPEPNVAPCNTPLPSNPDTGFPYTTYYFRTHFQASDVAPDSVLRFSDAVDDGAVLYLNGVEVYRLRMNAAPEPITNSTLASGYPCGGNADCPEGFELKGDAISSLQPGDNVLAVEVHNYNQQSPDITFGLGLQILQPQVRPPRLEVAWSGGELTLNWTGSGFVLQEAETLGAAWSDVAGPITSGPYKTTPAARTHFYRLRHAPI